MQSTSVNMVELKMTISLKVVQFTGDICYHVVLNLEWYSKLFYVCVLYIYFLHQVEFAVYAYTFQKLKQGESPG